MQIEVNINGTVQVFDVEEAFSTSPISYMINAEQYLPEFLKQSERKFIFKYSVFINSKNFIILSILFFDRLYFLHIFI